MTASSVQTIPYLTFVKNDSIARKARMLTAGNLYLFGQTVFGALEGLVVRIIYYIAAVFASFSEKGKEKINGIYTYSVAAFHKAHAAIHTIDQNFAKIFCSNFQKDRINLKEAKEKIKEARRQQVMRANELRKKLEKEQEKSIFQRMWQSVWPSNKSTTRKIFTLVIYTSILIGIGKSLPSQKEALRFFNRNFQKLPFTKSLSLWLKNLNFGQIFTGLYRRFK